MSGDQPANSFGSPNAQQQPPPPTPRQTPTSAVFPSPAFETPRAHHESRFADPGAWTNPHFAEEYSVFNSTPGNLNSSQDTFTASTPAAPALHARTPSLFSKRPLSAGDIAAEIASHANHFSPGPNLPSVDPSLRLPSSSQVPSSTRPAYSPPPDTPRTKGAAGPHSKKNDGAHTGGTQKPPTQTATPPPSARKADRTLVSGPTQATMQNDEGYGHQDFLGAAQPADMAAFAAAPNDMFGYPMSAPVTTSPSFWDSSIPMTAMDLDFASQNPTTSGMLFETPASSQQPGETYDWSANAALFQGPSNVPNMAPQSSNQENIQPAARKERPLAPKPTASEPSAQPGATTTESSALSGTYPVAANNGFVLSPGRGVDPGLLFSRPPSSDMDTSSFQPVGRPDPGTGALAEPAPLISSNLGSDGVKRSFSYKETNGRAAREAVSSPTKPTGPKAGLQRSFSENRGRRQLPALAPAARPQVPQASGSGVVSNRPQPRQSGRISPSKLHHRLSSLTSIPESSGPRTRTSVKFTIDARGRAHAETTTVVDEPGPSGIYRRSSRDSGRHSRVMESDPEDSDADDEPIIIPSRNASFALPDPHKPVGSIFHSSGRKSPRMRASFSFDDRNRAGHCPDDNDDESEAETVVNGAGKGDATSELRKVVEDRQKRAASQRSRRIDTGSFTWAAGNLMSPTTLTDSSIPTPSTGPRHYRIRCVCHRNEPDGAIDAFMVQWYVRAPSLAGELAHDALHLEAGGWLTRTDNSEACELWLHGRCINITRRDMPPVYICAFCANTPNMRGGRIRDTGRSGMAQPISHAPSPLAHKSFKSFR